MSLRILAIAIPFAVLTGAIRGALEGRQHFGAVNALRVPHGLITFLGPVAVLPFSRSVVPAMVFITAGRAVLCIAHYVVARRVIPEFGATPAFVTTIARRLVGFGGWLQVTYVVSPLMATLDRFVVGAVLCLGMVAFYATPTELVTKLWLFVFATSPVFFSAFTTTALRDPERTTLLFDRMLRLTVAVLFVPALVLVALAPEILRLWLGPEFVAPSTRVMQVLTVAVFVNCAGQAAYTLVQALGRPDITGKYHLVELPVYALLLWILLPPYGILGVAIAWALRTVGDSVLLFATCPRLLRPSAAPIARISMWLVATSGIMLAALWLDGTIARLALVVAASGGWSMLTWRYLLTPDERQLALSKILTLPALSR